MMACTSLTMADRFKKETLERKERMNRGPLAGEVESKSYFKCCFNREHQDEELSENDEYAPHEKLPFQAPKSIHGCPTCKKQMHLKTKIEQKDIDKVEEKARN